MKKKLLYYSLFSFILLCASIIYSLPFSLPEAKGNSYELASTYFHFLFSCDEEKIKASNFILENMEGHYSYTSTAINSFSDTITNCDSIMQKDQMNQIWEKLSTRAEIKRQLDINTITTDFLTTDIESAITTWRKSSWKQEVSFETFCSFILPYRVMNEKVEKGWREHLKSKYKHIVQGVTDLKKAFYLVHDSISRKTKGIWYDYPYQLNPFEMEHVMKGNCLQRCIYEVAIMRALGIPATIDGIDCWANYSKTGHTWVTLVTQNGTYTCTKNDTIAKKHNPIDASIFKLDKSITKPFPHDTTFQKRCAKVLRHHFKTMANEYCDKESPLYIRKRFSDKHISDVSSEYNLTGTYSLTTSTHTNYTYLCVYRINKGWYPIAYSKSVNGEHFFTNIGDSCIYIPAYYRNKRLTPLGYPFKMVKNKAIAITPSQTQKEEITVTRKYPMINDFYTHWARMKGSTISTSKTQDFLHSKTIWTINNTPDYRNMFVLKKPQKCRYINFQAPEGIKSPFAEIAFFKSNQILDTTPYSEDAEELNKCIDHNYFSCPKIIKRGYQILFDFKRQVYLDKILFVCKNDGNYIVPGHNYTLLYYDQDWKCLQTQVAKSYELSFKNVPTGALLLLKDNDEGSEERPFIYKNGKQEWW